MTDSSALLPTTPPCKELDAKVYSVIRYPATYKAFDSALRYSFIHLENIDISNALDVGAGSASASISLLHSLPSIKSIDLLEKEDVMIDIGDYLLSHIDHSSTSISYHKCDITKDELSSSKYDLVFSSYVLNELEKDDILPVIKKMWEATNKVMLVVEPGTPKGFEIIKMIREYLLSQNGYILAPCPHMNSCPMFSSDWCHFSTRVSRSKLHKELKGGDVPYEDEKYCYIAFSKSPCSRCENRILRHPQISSGFITLEVCSKDGFKIMKVTKKEKERFKAARKSAAGDEIL